MAYLRFKSTEKMIEFLLRANVDAHHLRQKEFHHDAAFAKCWISVADFNLPKSKNDISVLSDQYPSGDIVEDSDVTAIQTMQKSRIHNRIEKMKPEYAQSMGKVSSAMVKINTRTRFIEAIRFLCELSVENIRSLKIDEGDRETYLIWIPFIKTPACLTWFLSQPGETESTVFYPIYRSSYDIWVEWGFRFNFSDQRFYQILFSDAQANLLIHRNGNRTKLLKNINEFVPVIKFCKLSFSNRSQTNTAEARDFQPHEMEFTLKLIKETHRTTAEKKLEKLTQKEENIRREIEWLRSLNALYKDLNIQYMYFYPLGLDGTGRYHKDPVFPEVFFSRHSLSQLQRLCFFYGEMGSLGEGVMLSSKYVAHNDAVSRLNLSNSVKPRKGMIFQSNPVWLEKAGLKIFSPVGFNVFPYLIDIDPSDIKKIVVALIDAYVWGVRQNAKGVREQTASEEELKKKADEIRANPLKFIYFLYPKMDLAHSDDETEELECLALNQTQFMNFNIKFQNLGLYFSLPRTQQQQIDQYGVNALDLNFSNQVKQCQERLDHSVEHSFQKHRTSLHEKISEFDEFMDVKSSQIDEMQTSLKDSQVRIDKKEELKKVYEAYLDRRIDGFRKMESSRDNIESFIRNTQKFFSEMFRDLNNIILNGLEDYDAQIKKLKELEGKVQEANEEVESFNSKRLQLSDAVNTIEEMENSLRQAFSGIDWKKLDADEPIKKLWALQKSLAKLMDLLSNYLQEIGVKNRQIALPVQIPQYAQIGSWMDDLVKQIKASDGKVLLKNEPMETVVETIRMAIEEVKQAAAVSSEKKKIYEEIRYHFDALKKII